MASSTLILVLLIFVSSSAFTGVCGSLMGRGSSVSRMLPCMEFLMRCQFYLTDPKPPDSCCGPIKYVMETNIECVCSIIMNDAMLVYLNISFEDSITLPVRCNLVLPDLSKCSMFELPNITVANAVDEPASTSHAGQSKYYLGFREILTSAVSTLLVSRILFFAHVL